MTFTKEQLKDLRGVDFNDEKVFIDEHCFNNCYFYNVCPNCYGANYLMSGKLNERDKGICNLIKIRAYYSAAIKAHNILTYPDKFASDKPKVALQIRAIKRIREICPPRPRESADEFQDSKLTKENKSIAEEAWWSCNGGCSGTCEGSCYDTCADNCEVCGDN